MRAATFPESWRSNPFLDLLESHLSKQGVEFEKVGSDYLTVKWLFRRRRKVDVLHFHWLQYHYLRKSALVSWLALLKFCLKLELAKLCGYRIVWTMHNLLPHERPYRFLDRACYSIMAHGSDSIVTLCNRARLSLEETYGRRENVFSSYHGVYSNVYPNWVSLEEARNQLKLPPHRKVFLFFGEIKAYKGVDELIHAFEALEIKDVCLIIAGKADTETRAQILASIGGNVCSRTIFDWIPDEQVQYYFNACDFVVLPFVNVMSSGSVMLALSFGRAVIAPAIGCLPEIIGIESGILYDPLAPDGLLTALRQALICDVKKMSECARQSALRYRWEDLSNVTLRAYQVT